MSKCRSDFYGTWAKRLLSSIAAIAAFSFTVTAYSQPTTLRMATIPVPNSFYAEMMHTVAKRITDATKGQVKVEIYDSLIPGNELASAVRTGRVEMAGVIHPYLSAESPILTLSHLPGLIDTAAEYYFALHTFWGDVMDDIFLKKYGSKSLLEGIWATQIIWSMKPIKTIEDFKGLKIRVHNSEAAHLMVQLGAKPTPISAGEMLPALQRGVIDAIITSVDVAQGLGFGNVAKYAQAWHFSSRAGWAVVMNKRAWDKLSENQQKIIQTEMASIEKDFYKHYNEKNAALIRSVQSSGTKYYVVPTEELNRLYNKKYIGPVYDAWLKRAGPAGEKVLKEAESVLGKQIDY